SPEHLDRHRLVHEGVYRAVYRPHASASELRDQAIPSAEDPPEIGVGAGRRYRGTAASGAGHQRRAVTRTEVAIVLERSFAGRADEHAKLGYQAPTSLARRAGSLRGPRPCGSEPHAALGAEAEPVLDQVR